MLFRSSVSDNARLNFIENTCAPHAARLTASLRPLLEAFGPDLNCYFDFDQLPVMQSARWQRVATATALFQMSVPFNDLNRVLDLGFPEYDWGDQGYLPFSLQATGKPAAPAVPPASTDNADTTGAASLRKALAVLERGLKPETTDQKPAHLCAGSAEYEASIEGAVRAMRGRAQKFFFEQRVRVLRALEQQQKSLTRALGDDIFKTAAENEAIKASFKPVLLKQFEFGGAQLWQEFGLGDFTLKPQAAMDYLAAAGTRWEEINNLTHTNLRETLIQGLDGGESFAQLADRVRAVFDDGADIRANTIALTETNTAINAGRNEGLMQSPLEKKVWLSANLENSRPAHQEAGQRYADGIAKEEPFVLETGAKLMFPGDTSLGAGPSDTINCKCHMGGMSGLKMLRAARRTAAGNGVKLLAWSEWIKTA